MVRLTILLIVSILLFACNSVPSKEHSIEHNQVSFDQLDCEQLFMAIRATYNGEQNDTSSVRKGSVQASGSGVIPIVTAGYLVGASYFEKKRLKEMEQKIDGLSDVFVKRNCDIPAPSGQLDKAFRQVAVDKAEVYPIVRTGYQPS